MLGVHGSPDGLFWNTHLLGSLTANHSVRLGALTAIQRTNKDATLTESLKIWPDLVAVYRKNPRDEDQFWHAHPSFARVHIRKDYEIENYVTLTGGNREIELGSFLTAEERLKLFEELDRQLYQAKFASK